MFFFERGDGYSPVMAAVRALCRSCPVQPQCLDYAMTTRGVDFGTWGGYTQAERRRLRTMIA